jgi:hypothetical protein
VTPLVAELEWRIALARRRLFALNALVPLALATPLALGAAPPFHAAAVYTVLFALFGTFGSTIPVVRDAESGLLGRMVLGGVSPAGYVVQRAAAGAVLDGVQLLPATLVAAVGAGASPIAFAAVTLALWLTLWVANLLGVILAAVARSVAEAALFAATGALLLLHASGVFRTPAPGSWGAMLERGSPFRSLHEALLAMTSGSEIAGGSTLVIWALTLPVLLGALGRPLIRALGRAERA